MTELTEIVKVIVLLQQLVIGVGTLAFLMLVAVRQEEKGRVATALTVAQWSIPLAIWMAYLARPYLLILETTLKP